VGTSTVRYSGESVPEKEACWCCGRGVGSFWYGVRHVSSSVSAVSPETLAGLLLLNCSENCWVNPEVQDLSVNIKIVREGS